MSVDHFQKKPAQLQFHPERDCIPKLHYPGPNCVPVIFVPHGTWLAPGLKLDEVDIPLPTTGS
ncbi:hypothetical protein C5167_038634, partial [Papaver somniferum]